MCVWGGGIVKGYVIIEFFLIYRIQFQTQG